MENNDVPARKSPSRRLFLSASAATAVAAPLVTQAATAHAATTSAAAGIRSATRIDPDLRKMLKEIDPARIKAIITTLAAFGTRHTASSQTDPVRGIGAATAWVTEQMQAIAATSAAG